MTLSNAYFCLVFPQYFGHRFFVLLFWKTCVKTIRTLLFILTVSLTEALPPFFSNTFANLCFILSIFHSTTTLANLFFLLQNFLENRKYSLKLSSPSFPLSLIFLSVSLPLQSFKIPANDKVHKMIREVFWVLCSDLTWNFMPDQLPSYYVRLTTCMIYWNRLLHVRV